MCRLLAIPPNFPRKEALDILKNMENANLDGVGSTYLNEKGEFITKKYPTSLKSILRRGVKFLDHLPHKGWTIIHLRLASHGKNTLANTHPFIVGDWAICHNGVWSEYNIAKLVMEKTTDIKFNGETDTEVAANLINMISPKTFSKEISFGGVYLCLNKDGSLHVAKTSGELSLFELSSGQALISSELDAMKYSAALEALCGWYHFSKEGIYLEHEPVYDSVVTNADTIDDEEEPAYPPYNEVDSYWGRLDRTYGHGVVVSKPKSKVPKNPFFSKTYPNTAVVVKRPNAFLKKTVFKQPKWYAGL